MKKLLPVLKLIRVLSPWILLFLAGACSSLKYVPENEYLLNDVKIKVEQAEIDKDKLYLFVRQRENTRILGFLKFHLWLYNLSKPGKDNWMKRTGEPPQVYNPALADQSTEQLLTYLHNKGYYDAEIELSSQLHKNSRKIDLKYLIQTGTQFSIDQVKFQIPDSVVQSLFLQDYSPRYLKTGSPLDMELLDTERDSIIRFFKNRGYYHFSKSMLYIEADTTGKKGEGDLKLFIRLPEASRKDSARIYRPYTIDHYFYNVSRSGAGPMVSDTVTDRQHTFIFPPNLW